MLTESGVPREEHPFGYPPGGCDVAVDLDRRHISFANYDLDNTNGTDDSAGAAAVVTDTTTRETTVSTGLAMVVTGSSVSQTADRKRTRTAVAQADIDTSTPLDTTKGDEGATVLAATCSVIQATVDTGASASGLQRRKSRRLDPHQPTDEWHVAPHPFVNGGACVNTVCLFT